MADPNYVKASFEGKKFSIYLICKKNYEPMFLFHIHSFSNWHFSTFTILHKEILQGSKNIYYYNLEQTVSLCTYFKNQ